MYVPTGCEHYTSVVHLVLFSLDQCSLNTNTSEVFCKILNDVSSRNSWGRLLLIADEGKSIVLFFLSFFPSFFCIYFCNVIILFVKKTDSNKFSQENLALLEGSVIIGTAYTRSSPFDFDIMLNWRRFALFVLMKLKFHYDYKLHILDKLYH